MEKFSIDRFLTLWMYSFSNPTIPRGFLVASSCNYKTRKMLNDLSTYLPS